MTSVWDIVESDPEESKEIQEEARMYIQPSDDELKRYAELWEAGKLETQLNNTDNE